MKYYVYVVYRYESDADCDIFCVCATSGLAQKYVNCLQKDGWHSATFERWAVDTKLQYTSVAN